MWTDISYVYILKNCLFTRCARYKRVYPRGYYKAFIPLRINVPPLLLMTVQALDVRKTCRAACECDLYFVPGS